MNDRVNDHVTTAPDDFERRLATLLNGSVDELAGPRPAIPPFEPSPRVAAPGRRAPWVLPLLAAACVVLVGGGAVAATQLAGRHHDVHPGVTDRPTLPPTSTPTSASTAPSSTAPAAGPTVAAVTPSGSGSVRPSGSDAPTGASGSATGRQPLETLTVQSNSGTPTTHRVSIWARDVVTDCADHAYGAKIVAFLRQNPCVQAHRVLGTTTVNGRPVAYSAVTVDLAAGAHAGPPDYGYAVASQFAKLENTDGTGSVNDLLREGATLPGATAVPSDELFRTLGEDSSVTVYNVWYLDGGRSSGDAGLTKLTVDLYLTKAIFG